MQVHTGANAAASANFYIAIHMHALRKVKPYAISHVFANNVAAHNLLGSPQAFHGVYPAHVIVRNAFGNHRQVLPACKAGKLGKVYLASHATLMQLSKSLCRKRAGNKIHPGIDGRNLSLLWGAITLFNNLRLLAVYQYAAIAGWVYHVAG